MWTSARIPHLEMLQSRIAGAGAVLLLFTFATPVAIVAQEEICLDCHDTELTSPVHGDLGCSDCHFDVDLDTHPDGEIAIVDREICANCHDIDPALEEGAHREIECSSCHDSAHSLLPPSDPASPLAAVSQIQTCGRCHDDPPELLSRYLGSEHARALLVSGLIVAPSCSDCHGGHRVFASDDPRATISRDHVPETCGSCHRLILDTWREGSAHGMAWSHRDEEAPTCVTCHRSHAIMEPTERAQRLQFPEGCGDCHEDYYRTYQDSFHGHATDLGFQTAAICSDCHTPHNNLAASDPRSSVHADNLPATCGNCHRDVSASFVSFDPHADPSDPRGNRAVYFVWLFMHALLLGVVGFFLVHDTLWLQRSIVGMLRGENERWRTDGPWVRRFDRKGRNLHLVVITTFLLLALTGLPLKFHYADWAKSLAGALGGVTVTGFLHRLAGLATFGYFFFHLFDLARRKLVDGERGLFYGWSSMMPRWKDFTDLWGHVKHFLYLGPRPRFDRWSYWEKFDYFAVFWGVVIIGTSGLILWFPELVTRVLPGWVLNAAFVTHSEEAFLAVGFIFIFHFFHTHLRPGSFPMDLSIFLGSQPLERFRDERPLEYQRLVEASELEALIVEAPSRRRVRRAYMIGTVALTVGLLLAIAIVWTLITH